MSFLRSFMRRNFLNKQNDRKSDSVAIILVESNLPLFPILGFNGAVSTNANQSPQGQRGCERCSLVRFDYFRDCVFVFPIFRYAEVIILRRELPYECPTYAPLCSGISVNLKRMDLALSDGFWRNFVNKSVYRVAGGNGRGPDTLIREHKKPRCYES